MFSQNVIEIHPVNGKLDIKYFPVIEEFTNPFYGVSIKPNVDGYYNLDIGYIKNKVVIFIINNKQIEIYVKKNDSIKIFFDAIKNNFVLYGANKDIHENYNILLTEYRRNFPYEKLFDYHNFNQTTTDVIDDIKQKVIVETDKINRLLDYDSLNVCHRAYLTFFHISMLIWIKEGFPEYLQFQEYFQDILKIFNFNEYDIKGSSNGFSYYDIYYKSIKSKDLVFTNNSIWLNQYSYLLNAPDNIRDYLLQCQYIGQYNSIRPYVDWCELLTEIEVIFDKIYFTSFFDEHKPCK